ncbi:hypothetical protein V1264_019269 [Littorina saxatilis]|uniref:Uncharacterized protein n=1 Tax=Littorina saxatilis TaxID=31220 RepID=A0AAN9BGX1_9CAEN
MGRRVEAPLPAWEQTTYWIVGVSSILYGLYNVFLASLDLQDKLEYVEDGYEILGRKQDVEDYEWYIYSMYFCWKLPPLLLLHIAVSRAMFLLNIDVQTRKYVYVLNGVMLAWGLQSWRFSLLLCLTPVPFFAASALRSVPAVWAVSVAATYLCNAYADDLMNLLGVTDSLNYFVVIYIWASVFLRCTCCAVERVWSLNQATFASTPGHSKNSSRVTRTGSSQNSSAGSAKKRSTSACQKENGCQSDTQGQLYDWPVLSKMPSVCDMYLCVFYTPSLFTGPPVTFKSFIEQVQLYYARAA